MSQVFEVPLSNELEEEDQEKQPFQVPLSFEEEKQQPSEEEKPKQKFEVPLSTDPQSGGYASAFKFRYGSKAWDGLVGAGEQAMQLPQQMARSAEKAAIMDIIDDLDRSLGQDDRSLLENVFLRGSGIRYEFQKQKIENELGLADRGNLSIVWNAVLGSEDPVKQQLKYKKIPKEERLAMRKELEIMAKEHEQNVKKINNEYHKKKLKQYQDKGYTKEEIALVGGVSSLVPSLVSMGAAVFTRNPKVAYTTLPYFGLLTQQQTYEDSIAKGLSDKDARYNSYIQGGTEVSTELLTGFTVVKSLEKLMAGQKQNIKNIALEGTGIFLAESGGEQLNTVAQSISDAYFDNKDELRIAWKIADNPLYEGPSWFDIMTDRAKLTSISSLVAGGGIVTTNGVIKYNASKDWIKNSDTPEKTKELIDNLILQKELDKVAFDQGAAKAMEQDALDDKNINPLEFVAEEILKVEAPGRREKSVDPDPADAREPVNQVDNIDDALDNIKIFLEAKGYDTKEMQLTTGKDFAAETNQEPDNLIKFRNSLGFGVDLNNVEATANKIDEFIVDRNAESKFKKKVKKQPKEKLVLPKTFVPKRANSLLYGAVPFNAFDIEETATALGYDKKNIPLIYRTKNAAVSPIDGTTNISIGDILSQKLFEENIGRQLNEEGKPSEFGPQEAYDILAQNPILPKDEKKYLNYINEMDQKIGDFVQKNPGATVEQITKAAGRRNTVEIENSLDRLQDSNAFSSDTRTGEKKYYASPEPMIEPTEANIDWTLEEVPDEAQPMDLETFEAMNEELKNIIPTLPADAYFDPQDKMPIYPEMQRYQAKNPIPKAKKPKEPVVVDDGTGGNKNLDGGSNITDDSWGIGFESKLQKQKVDLEFNFQNVLGRLKDVEKAYDKRAAELGMERLSISEKPSEAAVRMPGVINTKQVESLKQAEDIIEKMAKYNLQGEQVDIVAIALHAPERNKHIYAKKLKDIDEFQQKIGETPSKEDATKLEKLKQEAARFENNGSGVQTDEAIRVLKRYDIEFDGIDANATSEKGSQYLELVNEYHNFIKQTVVENNKGGLLDDATAEDYKSNANWKYYVPLTGRAADTTADGKPNLQKGLNIKGPEYMEAKGRTSVSNSPFVEMVLQRQRAIERSVKNDFLSRISKLVTEEFAGSDVAEVTTTKPKEMDGVFGFKQDGKQKYLKVYDQPLIRALNAYDAQHMNWFNKKMRVFTRLQSALYTAFSPPFILYNFSRDLVAGGLAIHTEQNLPGGRAEGKSILKKSIKNVPVRLGQFHKGIKGKEIKEEGIQEAYDLFNKYGANSGFVTTLGQDRIADFYKDVQKKHSNVSLDESRTSLLLKTPGKALKGTADFMYDLNSAVENGIRFSTFVEFIKSENNGQIKGAKKETLEQAASLAKQLTIDYTTKGHLGAAINAHFIFFNAAVQSNIPLYRALAKSPKVAAQIGGGIATYGAMLTLYNFMISDEDETGRPIYENLAERYGNRYVITMLPGAKFKSTDELPELKGFGGPIEVNGKVVAFAYPQPLGFNIPFNIARQAVELNAHQIFDLGRPMKSPSKAALEIFDNFSTGVMPIGVSVSKKDGLEGFASTFVRTVTPSYAKPISEIAINENWLGIPITKEFIGGRKGIPNSQVVTSYDKDLYVEMAKVVNNMTGGDNKTLESGFVDLQPGQIEYIVRYYGGGPMSFASGLYETAHRFAYDEIQDVKSIPFANTYLIQEQDGIYARRYYDAKEDIETKVNRYKNITDPEAKEKYYNENKNVISLYYTDPATQELLKGIPAQFRKKKKLTEIRSKEKTIKEAQKTVVALKLREKDPSAYYKKIDKIKDQKYDLYIDLLKEYEKAMNADFKSQSQ